MDSSHNYLIVSDLHLSEGRDPQTGRLSRIEDFFHDESFARMLVYHQQLRREAAVSQAYDKPWRLIINGDILDFLQVVSLPPSTHPIFTKYGVKLTQRKIRYGLGTSEPETVWKLHQIVIGHPTFFRALGWFLAHEGNELILLKGNHDIEFYWPKVQQAFRHLVNQSYQAWREGVSHGILPDSPLPFDSSLTAELADLDARIQFPPWIYYVPDLLYVEHGNQYDPYNFFTDFVRPLLPERPHLIELPRGSFFVRYLFNMLEGLHPIADNMKPFSRFVNWAISQDFRRTFRLLFIENFTMTWQAIKSLWAKRGVFNQAITQKVGKAEVPPPPAPLPMERRSKIFKLQEKYRLLARNDSNQRSFRTVLGLVLRIVSLVLVLFAVRHFFLADYSSMWAFALSAVFSFFTGTYLWRNVADAENYSRLEDAAEGVSEVLAEPIDGQTQSVPLLVFGHNHLPELLEITADGKDKRAAPFRQWYVNTGSWLPTFENDESRLLPKNIQLTFLRVVPSLPNFEENVPELMEWQVGVEEPRPIQVFREHA